MVKPVYTSSDTAYQQEVKDKVVTLLASELLTTRELETRLQLSYPTVRRAVVELVNEGKVLKFDNRARGSRYTIAPDDTRPKKFIPSLIFKGKTLPLTAVYRDQGLEELAANCADAILEAWTAIATTARRLNEGLPEEVTLRQLNRQKVKLVQAHSNLEQLGFMIRQILDNERLWDATTLQNFPEDPEWKEFLPHLDELYKRYYGLQEN